MKIVAKYRSSRNQYTVMPLSFPFLCLTIIFKDLKDESDDQLFILKHGSGFKTMMNAIA
jgi:hypothetical protein